MPEWTGSFVSWLFTAVITGLLVNYFSPDLRAYIDKARARHSQARREKMEKAHNEKWARTLELAADRSLMQSLQHSILTGLARALFLMLIALFVLVAELSISRFHEDSLSAGGWTVVALILSGVLLLAALGTYGNTLSGTQEVEDAEAFMDEGKPSSPNEASPAPPGAR